MICHCVSSTGCTFYMSYHELLALWILAISSNHFYIKFIIGKLFHLLLALASHGRFTTSRFKKGKQRNKDRTPWPEVSAHISKAIPYISLSFSAIRVRNVLLFVDTSQLGCIYTYFARFFENDRGRQTLLGGLPGPRAPS